MLTAECVSETHHLTREKHREFSNFLMLTWSVHVVTELTRPLPTPVRAEKTSDLRSTLKGTNAQRITAKKKKAPETIQRRIPRTSKRRISRTEKQTKIKDG